jgi:hypothetical protein
MSKPANLSERDLSQIDLRTLSAEEWDGVKREVNRRAHAERKRVMRAVVVRLARLARRGMETGHPLPKADASHQELLPFAGRI